MECFVKRFLLRCALRLVPPRYLSRLMYHLSEMSFVRWAGVDEEILLEQAISSSSICTDPNGVERELIDWIRNYLKPGQVFYDVGANVGAYSLYAAKHHRSLPVKVFAFEPAAPTNPAVDPQYYPQWICTDTVVPMLTFPLAARPTLAKIQLLRHADAGPR